MHKNIEKERFKEAFFLVLDVLVCKNDAEDVVRQDVVYILGLNQALTVYSAELMMLHNVTDSIFGLVRVENHNLRNPGTFSLTLDGHSDGLRTVMRRCSCFDVPCGYIHAADSHDNNGEERTDLLKHINTFTFLFCQYSFGKKIF